MARRHAAASGCKYLFKQMSKLDPGVADNAGIWCFPPEIVPGEVGKNGLFKFIFEVDNSKGDMQVVGKPLFFNRDAVTELSTPPLIATPTEIVLSLFPDSGFIVSECSIMHTMYSWIVMTIKWRNNE